MNRFWKINLIGILYAIIIFIPVELFLNVLRISRITGWAIQALEIGSIVLAVVLVCILSVFVYSLTRRWLSECTSSLWTVVLWIPYFVLFVFWIAKAFPADNPSDQSGPGGGIILMGLLLGYPLFVFMLNASGTFRRPADE